jgi:hypothetical protein
MLYYTSSALRTSPLQDLLVLLLPGSGDRGAGATGWSTDGVGAQGSRPAGAMGCSAAQACSRAGVAATAWRAARGRERAREKCAWAKDVRTAKWERDDAGC